MWKNITFSVIDCVLCQVYKASRIGMFIGLGAISGFVFVALVFCSSLDYKRV